MVSESRVANEREFGGSLTSWVLSKETSCVLTSWVTSWVLSKEKTLRLMDMGAQEKQTKCRIKSLHI